MNEREKLAWEKTRGMYEPDEIRIPLDQRMNGKWTLFEAHLFNMLTREMDRSVSGPMLFTRRLALCQRMLEALDTGLKDPTLS